jgi:hypothetical protein
MKIHHAIIKSLAALDLVAVPHLTEAGMLSIQMDGVEIIAGRIEDVKELSAKAKDIVSDEDFDLEALREEGDGVNEGDDEAGDEQGDEQGDEAEAEDEGTGSVVRELYRKKYRAINQHDSNGDEIAQAMRAAVTTQVPPAGESKAKAKEAMSLETLLAIADQNGLASPKGANPGQRRMNLGNSLRGLLRKGLAVHIQGTTIEPTEEAKAKRAARFEADRVRAEAKAAPKPTKEEQAAARNAKAKARRAVVAAQKAQPKAEDTQAQAGA